MSFIDSFSKFLIENFSTAGFTDNFHFIRPWWLLAFIALGVTLHLLKKMRYYQSPWQHFLPAHLTKILLEENDNAATKHSVEKKQSPSQVKPFIIGCCLILALAGPAWQQLPQPVYQLERGSVLIMDMSYSMYSTDIKPNRLTRSRYKAVDLLEKINEGDMGLIAYAGDAFIISPLTQDIHNIELLLPSLSPDIMPVLGANALYALTLAHETLKNAGHLNGDIYWFTDDIDNEEMSDIYDWSAKFGHNLHILGVGTESGAPVTLSSGELLKDNSGAIVVPKLPSGRLAALAKRSGGNYSTITNDDSDINHLTKHLTTGLADSSAQNSDKTPLNNREKNQQMQGDQYQEHGPWLLFIVIPLLLSYFRRGSTILSVSLLMPLTMFIGFGLVGFSAPSYAADSSKQEEIMPTQSSTEMQAQSQSSVSGLWQDIWQTKDQQAQKNFQQENYNQAADQFENKQWQGSAHYKAGNYQQALDAFKESDSSNALYNQGNSHAQMKQYDQAIEAYKKALEKDPNLKDAQDNIEQIEALKKQQEKQQKQDGEQSESSDEKQEDSEQNSEQNKDQSQDSKESSQENNKDQQEGGESQDQSEQQQDKDASEKEAEQQEQSQQSKEESKEQAEEEKKKAEQEAQRKQEEKEGDEGEKTAAQIASEQKAQEDMQKHQQLLNKVTDDPYLLLRNKMRLEYQKRQREGNRQGVNKKW